MSGSWGDYTSQIRISLASFSCARSHSRFCTRLDFRIPGTPAGSGGDRGGFHIRWTMELKSPQACEQRHFAQETGDRKNAFGRYGSMGARVRRHRYERDSCGRCWRAGERSGLTLREFGQPRGIPLTSLTWWWWRQVFRRAAEHLNAASKSVPAGGAVVFMKC